ncbi:MAG: hypothetical protein IPM07_08270 [Anaerolineales bacterium]|nr:hypothetical protein [Anaerolineales bacterium]
MAKTTAGAGSCVGQVDDAHRDLREFAADEGGHLVGVGTVETVTCHIDGHLTSDAVIARKRPICAAIERVGFHYHFLSCYPVLNR